MFFCLRVGTENIIKRRELFSSAYTFAWNIDDIGKLIFDFLLPEASAIAARTCTQFYVLMKRSFLLNQGAVYLKRASMPECFKYFQRITGLSTVIPIEFVTYIPSKCINTLGVTIDSTGRPPITHLSHVPLFDPIKFAHLTDLYLGGSYSQGPNFDLSVLSALPQLAMLNLNTFYLVHTAPPCASPQTLTNLEVERSTNLEALTEWLRYDTLTKLTMFENRFSNHWGAFEQEDYDNFIDFYAKVGSNVTYLDIYDDHSYKVCKTLLAFYAHPIYGVPVGATRNRKVRSTLWQVGGCAPTIFDEVAGSGGEERDFL